MRLGGVGAYLQKKKILSQNTKQKQTNRKERKEKRKNERKEGREKDYMRKRLKIQGCSL